VDGRKGRHPQGTRRPVLDCVKSMMFYGEPFIYHHISDHSLLGFRGPDLLHSCLVSSPVVLYCISQTHRFEFVTPSDSGA
jgi:hypothetical protein